MLTNYSAYKDLYLKCFTDDTEQDAEFLFETVLKKAERVCEYENGTPIAMLFLMDCRVQTKTESLPFYYLYADCTHPDHRGKGLMSKLLEKAKQKSLADGKMGIFLKPATPSLFDFYAKSGFEPFFKYTKISCSAKQFLSNIEIKKAIAPITQMTLKEWQMRRYEPLGLLTDIYADFEGDLFYSAAAGCTAVFAGGAAIVYELRGDTLLVKEAFCRKGNEKALLSLTGAVLLMLRRENIELRLPAVYSDDAFVGLDPKTDYFSVIWHNDNLNLSDYEAPYHGFAFD